MSSLPHLLQLIGHTAWTRPYVAAFFLTFLFLGVRTRGWLRTLFYLVLGYGVAWVSEASSIRTGFPYGWYFYIYENLQGDWLNYGVPVWDSLSYTFLCFAGLSLAEFLRNPKSFGKESQGQRRDDFIRSLGLKECLQIAVLSGIFTTLLDVVIDPVAHMGDRWFLGNIYYYPHPGVYFNVPLSNFLGWFLVSFLINFLYLAFESKTLKSSSSSDRLTLTTSSSVFNFADRYGGVLLYFGIFFFNWGITLWLGEMTLAVCDVFWIAFPAILFYRKSSFTHP